MEEKRRFNPQLYNEHYKNQPNNLLTNSPMEPSPATGQIKMKCARESAGPYFKEGAPVSIGGILKPFLQIQVLASRSKGGKVDREGKRGVVQHSGQDLQQGDTTS